MDNYKAIALEKLAKMSPDLLINGYTIEECIDQVERETDFGKTIIEVYRHSAKYGF